MHHGKEKESRRLTLGLLRGLVDKPEDAPLMERDLKRRRPGQRVLTTHTLTHTLFGKLEIRNHSNAQS